MTDAPTSAQRTFRDLLHAQRVWDVELPSFDPAAAPRTPLPLFHTWFAEAVAAGQVEPHTMTLATVDAEGRPDVRTLMLHDADDRGWHFATHATSAKGRQLAVSIVRREESVSQDTYRIIEHIGRGCLPLLRRKLLDALIDHSLFSPAGVSTTDLAVEIGYPTSTTRHWLQEISALGFRGSALTGVGEGGSMAREASHHRYL